VWRTQKKEVGVSREVDLLPAIARLLNVLLVRQANMLLREGVLQFRYVLGAEFCVRESSELDSSGNVPLLFNQNVTSTVAIGEESEK